MPSPPNCAGALDAVAGMTASPSTRAPTASTPRPQRTGENLIGGRPRLSFSAMPAPVDDAALASAVGRHLGEQVTIEGLRRLSGGASRETWSFDTTAADGTRDELVLRRDPSDLAGQVGRSVEFALLEAARAGGVAVPKVRFLLEPDDGLGSGFVMERVAGETIP